MPFGFGHKKEPTFPELSGADLRSELDFLLRRFEDNVVNGTNNVMYTTRPIGPMQRQGFIDDFMSVVRQKRFDATSLVQHDGKLRFDFVRPTATAPDAA